jgi:serine/threonine protein kinase/Tfp pilus assembly protein PilF
MIGKTILHYKILDKIGEGGMGVVYKAEDTKLKRTVALKFLPAHSSGSEEEEARFLHEAQAAAALDHPNICTIYEINESDEQTFIAMACIEGKSLQQYIAAGPLQINDILNYASQIAEGLKAAHDREILHRDIKPANILITDKKQIRITDFGLAKFPGATMVTKEGTTLGTIAYMSPEQARGENIDKRTDIWALGVVIYEMITGRKPFAGDYEQAVVYSIINEDPDPPTALRTGVPMELERIVGKALAKKPEERYQDCTDLLVDLKKLAKSLDQIDQPTTSRVVPIAKKPARLLHRQSLFWGALATAIIAVVLFYFLWHSEPTSDEGSSIAVLPFINQRNEQELEYLSDGITETLIDQLSPISNLKVMARSTVFQFEGPNTNPQNAGRKLNVKSVLTGRIDLFEDRLIISTELIDVASGAQLWGERYNRQMADIFKIEDEISKNIIDKLRLHLGAVQSEHITRRYTESSEAYQLYLKGRFYWNKRSPEAMPVALKYFQQAVDMDPNYALAWTGISDSYLVGSGGYLGISAEEAHEKGKAATLRAIEIDPDLAEAHTSLASVRTSKRDWSGAEKEFKRALELNPGYVTAHQWYGELLYILGRYDESVAEINRALELDPLSLIVNSVLGWSYLAARNAPKAMEQIQRTLEMEPEFADAQDALVQIMMLENRPENELFPELIKRDLGFNILYKEDLPEIKKAFEKNGLKGYWRLRLKILLKRSQSEYVWPAILVECYAQLGETQNAIHILEKLFEQKDEMISYIRIYVILDPLRSDPRFQSIVDRMNFPN